MLLHLLLLAQQDESPITNPGLWRRRFEEVDWSAFGMRVLAAAIVIVGAAVLAHFARRAVRRWVSRVTARGLVRVGGAAREARAELRARTLGDAMADVVTVVIWVMAIFTALDQLGLRLGTLVAGASIAGVAVGFGAQSMVKDFLAGFFILLEDQFGIGDVVRIREDVSGRVEDVNLRHTRLRSIDGTVWFIPNGEIRYLGNLSKEWSRALVDFHVAYGQDLDEVMGVIREKAEALREDDELGPKILEDVEILGVDELGEVGMKIRTYIKTVPLEQFPVMRRFRQDVVAELTRLGVVMAFKEPREGMDGAAGRERFKAAVASTDGSENGGGE